MKKQLFANCKRCNASFELKPGGAKIFCSIGCSNKMKPKKQLAQLEKTCLVCGLKYFICKSRRDTSFYCSTKCQHVGRLTRARNIKSLTKECLACKNSFQTYPSHNSISCSRQCASRLKKIESYEKFKKSCKACKKEFLPPRMAEGGIFCSYKCRGLSDRKERINRAGYWYLYKPDHPNSSKTGYIAEHRFIMEEHIGRLIEKNEHVHHKDHDKINNNIDNLEIITGSEHSRYHSSKMWKTRCRKKLSNEMIGNYNGKRRENGSN